MFCQPGFSVSVTSACSPIAGRNSNSKSVLTSPCLASPIRTCPSGANHTHHLSGLPLRLPSYCPPDRPGFGDRKSTRLNSSHLVISYAVFCLKKKQLPHRDGEHPTERRACGDRQC